MKLVFYTFDLCFGEISENILPTTGSLWLSTFQPITWRILTFMSTRNKRKFLKGKLKTLQSYMRGEGMGRGWYPQIEASQDFPLTEMTLISATAHQCRYRCCMVDT